MPNSEQISSQVSSEDSNEWWPSQTETTDWSILESNDAKSETQAAPVTSATFSQEAFQKAFDESRNNYNPDNLTEARRVVDVFTTIQHMVEQNQKDGKGPTSYEQAFNLLQADTKNALMFAEKRPNAGDSNKYHQELRSIDTALELYNKTFNSLVNASKNDASEPNIPDLSSQPEENQPQPITKIQNNSAEELPGDVIS